MDNLLNYLYLFVQKAVWIIALILIIALSGKPISAIINDPTTFSIGNFYCLYYFVWILTVVLSVYFIARIISHIVTAPEPMIFREKDIQKKDETTI